MKKLIITLLSVGLLGAVGCGDKPDETDPFEQAKKEKKAREDAVKKIDEATGTKTKKDDVVKTYSDIAAQAYADSVTTAKALQTAVHEFVTAAKGFTGAPDQNVPAQKALLDGIQAKLEAAQQAWRDSRVPYLQTEVYRFYDGPINSPNKTLGDKDDVDMETRINAWPLDESYIDYTCKYTGIPGTLDAPDSAHGFHCNPLDKAAGAPPINEKTYDQSIIGGLSKFSGLDNYDSLSESDKLELYKDLRGANQNEDIKLAGQDYGGGDEEEQCIKYDCVEKDDDGNFKCKEKKSLAQQTVMVHKKDENGNPVCNADGSPVMESIYVHHVTQGDANVSTGYHAIEFILWGQDFNPNGPGSRELTDFLPGADNVTGDSEKRATRRLNYLLAVTDMLVKDLEYLADQWKDGGEYRTKFLQDSTASFKKIFNGMKNLSVDETGGERIQPAVRLQNQEEEHSCFSDNTQVDMEKDLQGILNVFNGSYKALDANKNVTGTGVKEVLKLYVPLCKTDAFKGTDACKSGLVDVGELEAKLVKATKDAGDLIKPLDGRRYFDQMVLEYWPMGTKKENDGHRVLKALADDLASLDANYGAFSQVLNMEFTE